MAGRQIHRLKTEVCIIEVNAGEDGGYHFGSTKSKWGRNTKNSSFEVHNLTCFFGLPFCKPKKSALCWMVFWAGKPKVGCCAFGSGNQSCYVKVAFGPRLRLHPNVRWNAQKSAIYRSRWRSSVWSRESPRTPPRTPPTHHPMHLNLGTALVIFNTKLFFIVVSKLIGPIGNA